MDFETCFKTSSALLMEGAIGEKRISYYV